MKKITIILLALISIQTVLALSQNGYYKVNRLYVWTNGDAHVWVEKSGAHTCSDQTYPTRYLLHPDAKRYEQKFSLLLSSRVTREGVSMNYTCKNGKPYIDAIRY